MYGQYVYQCVYLIVLQFSGKNNVMQYTTVFWPENVKQDYKLQRPSSIVLNFGRFDETTETVYSSSQFIYLSSKTTSSRVVVIVSADAPAMRPCTETR